MLLWLYRLVFVPIALATSPFYLRRMHRRGGYKRHFSHRFGAHPRLPPAVPGVPRIWIQAVSVGEVLAVLPLLEALHRLTVEIYLTTTTSTGFRVADDRCRGLVIGIGYFPVDWWPFSARAWRRIAPDVAILTEGERWPEHLHQAGRREVPVLAINGRMSDRSFRRWRLFRPFADSIFRGITRLLASSPLDEQRFLELGFPREGLAMTGNIKLDITIPPLPPPDRDRLRRELGLPAEGLVLLGASTWAGEEAALCEALRRARGAGIHCSLLIVPRHAERRTEIERLLRGMGLRHHFRSRGIAAGEVDVAIGDTTGELRRLAQLADLAFIGKSLPPHTEGQTPVEAAALGKAILFGPGMTNFYAIANDLMAAGAVRVVADAEDLAVQSVALLQDSAARGAMAAAAQAWHRRNQGALARTLAEIRTEVDRVRQRQP